MKIVPSAFCHGVFESEIGVIYKGVTRLHLSTLRSQTSCGSEVADR